MIPNDPAPPSAPNPFLVPLPEPAPTVEVPPATNQSTVLLVLSIFGAIAVLGTVGLFWLINKAIDFEDVDRVNQSLVAIAVLTGIVSACIGYLAGALTNTRTPQP